MKKFLMLMLVMALLLSGCGQEKKETAASLSCKLSISCINLVDSIGQLTVGVICSVLPHLVGSYSQEHCKSERKDDGRNNKHSGHKTSGD